MKDKTKRGLLTWCLMMYGIIIAYKGLLICAALMGTFAVIVGMAENVKFFGDEEEPNEEEL